MSDGSTFQVDVDALGQLPAFLSEAGDELAGVGLDAPIARTGSAVGDRAVAALAASAGSFVRVGALAIESDAERLHEARRAYLATEAELSSSFERIRRGRWSPARRSVPR